MNHDKIMNLMDPIKNLYFRREFDEQSRDPLDQFIIDCKAEKKLFLIDTFCHFAVKALSMFAQSLGREAYKSGKNKEGTILHSKLVEFAQEVALFAPGESYSFLYNDKEVIVYLMREVKQLVGFLDGILEIEFLPVDEDRRFPAWKVVWHYKAKNDRR